MATDSTMAMAVVVDQTSQVVNAVEAILAHDEALDEKEATTWQEDILPSKYAEDLVQLDNGKKISSDPSNWECEESGSKENLWLNLSTGFIGSGRRNWDGSGGNGAAIRHFEQTGKKYPLAVKLGTITPRGADVFSYAEDENDMVTDPYLAEHLAHWGIDIMQMEKTEKTMTELQIELNKGFEFDKITEAGADLQPVTGMRRYYIDQNWTPKKLDVLVEAPQELDLEHLRSTGLQSGEDLLPEEATGTSSSEAAPQPDEAIVAQLVSMGFSENGSKRAVLATGNNSVEASMEWVLAHMGDSDFNDPPTSSVVPQRPEANPEAVGMLTSMGFTVEQASAALQASNQSLERAADWLFSHSDDLSSAVQAVQSKAGEASHPAGGVDLSLSDGVGRYRLVGFISHVGKDTGCGHYVCHIRKEDRWVIYNDEKVAFSAHPPIGLGYAYVYRRIDL
eukprot:jgi/Pico_ML_1/54120/g4541.t1